MTVAEQTIRWHKGHGTQNDFVVLPDPDGRTYADLSADLVRLLCDRRRGIGADGLLRVVRTSAEPAAEAFQDRAEWFMDFRNADGSVGEMCGNGVRVFARYLADAGLVGSDTELPVATRGGLKRVTYHEDGQLTVDMGPVSFPVADEVTVALGDRARSATAVDVSNPHAVAFVADLDELGPALTDLSWTPREAFPNGVNAEFVVRRGPGQLALRVLERGVGETWSCGTGACAAAATAARLDGVDRPATYRVDVPGGTLWVTLGSDGVAWLTGPAEVRLSGQFAG